MPRPSPLRRCSWALALLACLGSAHAAWMPDGPDADAPPSSTHRVLEAFVQVEPACSGATLSEAVQAILCINASGFKHAQRIHRGWQGKGLTRDWADTGWL